MKVDVIISAGDIKKEKVKDKTVVIIDMLRATSVITTAIANGCKEVLPVLTIEEAMELSRKNRDKFILGGERKALKIEGFDCSNSPKEYGREVVKNKSIILTTTNGTRAIKGSEEARNIYIGAMINAKAVAALLAVSKEDIVIVNAGTYNEFSMDDFICSGYIIDCLLSLTDLSSHGINIKGGDLSEIDVELSDIAKTAHYIYKMNRDIIGFIKNASHYKRIVELGLNDDLEYCCRKDLTKVVPIYKEGIIKKYIDRSSVVYL
ncbi:2-phosphosulfolactate phosphatase family protein [Candidatus Clostridium stratigraminis]|uniref:Probable 2-phosphosulfolactate phosphatase n=1 Tax=Candidatus Clostridium stratigraminis TaxID=3381661 RepID=A0ABW8T8D3_9CLOT